MQLTFGEERDAGPILALTIDSCGFLFNAPLIGEIVYARPTPHSSSPREKWFWITPTMMKAKADHEARVRGAASLLSPHKCLSHHPHKASPCPQVERSVGVRATQRDETIRGVSS